MALLAVTQGRPVGVDLEHHRPLPGRERLAARFFSAPEQAALASVPDGDEAAATFLRCWTRKEAYVKALGVGVFHDLEGFAVTCLAHEAPALTWSRADPDAPRHWSLAAPDVDPATWRPSPRQGRCAWSSGSGRRSPDWHSREVPMRQCSEPARPPKAKP